MSVFNDLYFRNDNGPEVSSNKEENENLAVDKVIKIKSSSRKHQPASGEGPKSPTKTVHATRLPRKSSTEDEASPSRYVYAIVP